MPNNLTASTPTAFLESHALDTLSTNERGALVAVNAGMDALRRLASLGFTPGAEITMIQNPRYGPLIVLVRNVRIAIGRGEAQKIQVRRHA